MVVVNTHLYGLHLGQSGGVRAARARRGGDRRGPPARGHRLRDLRHRARRRPLRRLARSVRVDPRRRTDSSTRSRRAASRSPGALAPRVGRRLRAGSTPSSPTPLALAAERARTGAAPRSAASPSDSGDVEARAPAGPEAGRRLTDELARRARPRRGRRRLGRGPGRTPEPAGRARSTWPPTSQATLWSKTTAVLTSATVAARRCRRGSASTPNGAASTSAVRPARRRQPVRLRGQRPPLLRRPPPRPPPDRPRGGAARRARGADRRRPAGARSPCSPAGGRWTRRSRRCARGCRCRCSPSATSRSRRSSSAFADEAEPACSPPWASGRASTCPGRTLSLVTIDRLPFPRPDEPLLQARRERARADAFRLVDLPRAVDAAGPGRRPAHPHGRPTGASSPCSTPAWPRPATAGTSSAPCPRCAAPTTAPRPRRSSGPCASHPPRSECADARPVSICALRSCAGRSECARTAPDVDPRTQNGWATQVRGRSTSRRRGRTRLRRPGGPTAGGSGRARSAVRRPARPRAGRRAGSSPASRRA